MGTVQLANELNVLAAGHYPVWEAREETGTLGSAPANDPPTSGSDGVSLTSGSGAREATTAIRAIVSIRPRNESWRRRVRFTVTYDAASTYRITINGTNVDTAATGGTVTTQVAAMVAAINANVTVAALVTASVDPDNAEYGIIVGDAALLGVDYSVGAARTVGGAGTLLLTVDAAYVEGRVWVQEGGEPASRDGSSWFPHPDQPFSTAIDSKGKTDTLDVGGYSRIYLELYDLAGFAGDAAGTGATITLAATARVGVCQLPTQT